MGYDDNSLMSTILRGSDCKTPFLSCNVFVLHAGNEQYVSILLFCCGDTPMFEHVVEEDGYAFGYQKSLIGYTCK